jgi:hypothetical protein
MQRFKILTCLMLMAVITFICRPAEAGRFVNLVAITVATDEGEVVVPVTPVKLNIASKPLIRAATAPVRYIKQRVCGPNGCVEKLVPVADCEGECPCGSDCACDPCNCPTLAEGTAPAAVVATEGPQHSILVGSAETAFMERGPARRFCRGVLGRVKDFIVNGGPIRQRLKARRGR